MVRNILERFLLLSGPSNFLILHCASLNRTRSNGEAEKRRYETCIEPADIKPEEAHTNRNIILKNLHLSFY